MRLMEVGTKQQSLGHKAEAYKLFDQSYELYCLFWGLNMKLLDLEDVKWIEESFDDVKKLSGQLSSLGETEGATGVETAAEATEENADGERPAGMLGRMKSFVRKAVDCCIE